ncbi:hypothetical protein [Frigoribacterium sp. CFBP9030]|uniref:hypothetical protein n=1 Tax=Frigoribacterium sp. CFBP9030 TaxID=3096537 RepID=UPI002A6B74DC|nr:hypothetical protein [Frigoribacterium sp. CFBP9030]MDY0890404.1 hypothetical protein [Frigoribacterium sp. CFBP9030]
MRVRPAGTATTVILIGAGVLTGCSAPGEATFATGDAKRAVVTVVDDTTAAIGGEWDVYSGPAVEGCTISDGRDGAAYSYITTLRPGGSDPEADVVAVERLWRDRGLTTERYESGGSDPILGVRGVGSAADSLDFLADVRMYSLSGLSACAEGDAVQMQNDGE